jgi:hypothetical protein
MPAPKHPGVPLPDDRPPIDEREELSEHGDIPLGEGYEFRPESDRWEVILKDPRKRVRTEPAPDAAAARRPGSRCRFSLPRLGLDAGHQ